MATLRMMLIGTGSFLIVSCNSGERQADVKNDASGIYVREYAVEISNPNTGEKTGIRQIRDSIFVKLGADGYEVSNRKWRMNDYDQEGWVTMAHADDRPMPTFMASFDDESNQLNPQNSDVSRSLLIDIGQGKLFRNSAKDIEYRKVR
jgi:hypothetical protein